VSAGRGNDVPTLVAAAERTIAAVDSCWLVTLDGLGAAQARPMGRLPLQQPFDWSLRFLVDRRSGKAGDILAQPRVTLVFQLRDEAFVSAQGSARLVVRASEVAARWLPAYDVYFPAGGERGNAGFIEVAVTHLQLWIRGVTAEPFGLRTTELTREPGGPWRLRG
jgi:general stress protein 26